MSNDNTPHTDPPVQPSSCPRPAGHLSPAVFIRLYSPQVTRAAAPVRGSQMFPDPPAEVHIPDSGTYSVVVNAVFEY